MRLTILQFGSYADAVHRFEQGGSETFYAQKYSVDFVAQLAAGAEDVSVVHLLDDAPEERLPSGVRSLGLRFYPQGGRPRHVELIRTLERLRPDHLIVGSPVVAALAWGWMRRVRTLPLFADSFPIGGPRSRLKLLLLARILNSDRIDWVANHNLAASLELVRIGVAASKVLPYDWPELMGLTDRAPRQLLRSRERSVAFVGQLIESKGVGDLLEALALLNARPAGPVWRATIVGSSVVDAGFQRKARELGLESRVHFTGRVPHDEVIPLMARHDVVVVPSRHGYPEALPMTIFEALCSRTPIVASDHPMFSLKLNDGRDALLFPAGDAAALAGRLDSLVTDPELYARLSSRSREAAAGFFCPLKFDELITAWLNDRPEDRDLLSTFSLSTGRYGSLAPLGPAGRPVGAAAYQSMLST
jgi:glycosyltransferase involved in cell wall biosynthesis